MALCHGWHKLNDVKLIFSFAGFKHRDIGFKLMVNTNNLLNLFAINIHVTDFTGDTDGFLSSANTWATL